MAWMVIAMQTKVPPPVYAVLVVLMAVGTNWLTPGWRVLPTATVWVGAAIMIAGAVLVGIAVLQLIRARTTIEPMDPSRTTMIVTTGVYRLTRNPMYLAMFAECLGLALILRNPVAMIGPLLFPVVITFMQIIPEERALRLKFGTEYEQYCARVRRWI